MLLRPLNELSLTLQIKAESPLLIKEGRYTETEKDHWSNRKIQDQVGNQQGDQADRRRKEIKAGFPSAIPISRNSLDEIETALMDDRRIDKVDGLRFYLPGSSIRGAWRSYLERWLRGFAPEDPRICDPFEERKENEFYSCSLLLSKRKTLVRAYADSCPVCRLFGSTRQGSRIAISDADRVEVNGQKTGRVVSREHINIQRHNQQVKPKPGPFKFFALQDAEFVIDVKLRNFELMHVALVVEAARALWERRIWLGSGKNKGYGAVVLTGFLAKLTYFGKDEPGRELRGIAEHAACDTAMRERYGLTAGTPVALTESAKWMPETPWRWSMELKHPELTEAADKIVKSMEENWGKVGKLSDRPREVTA